MVSQKQIQAFVNEVVARFRPAAVILFGSYAYGEPDGESDVDLLVVLRHRGSSMKKASEIRVACPRSFPMDLMVRSPSEIRRGLRMGDAFLREVTSKGVFLHEGDNSWMGGQGGGGFRGGGFAAWFAKEAQPGHCLLSFAAMHGEVPEGEVGGGGGEGSTNARSGTAAYVDTSAGAVVVNLAASASGNYELCGGSAISGPLSEIGGGEGIVEGRDRDSKVGAAELGFELRRGFRS
jgi:predicted nucleotidyltransferase